MFSLNITNVLQVFLLAGLIVISYEFINYNSEKKQTNIQNHLASGQIDSLIEEHRIDSIQMLQSNAEIQSDSTRLLEIVYSIRHDGLGDFAKMRFVNEGDSLLNNISKTSAKQKLIEQHNYRSSILINQLNTQIVFNNENIKEEWKAALYIILFGCLLSIISAGFLRQAELKKNLWEVVDRYKKGKIWLWCQSCGKNFSSAREKAKNIDGSVNHAYCKECFLNGNYTQGSIDKDIIINDLKLAIRNTPSKKEKDRMTNRLKSLERWETNEFKSNDLNFSLKTQSD